ncbi:MAG TPA: hypothetical protein VLI07_18610 [Candidatus Binatus sp.]|nr:hypothetical protein [Candidatus Binatus sp.]
MPGFVAPIPSSAYRPFDPGIAPNSSGPVIQGTVVGPPTRKRKGVVGQPLTIQSILGQLMGTIETPQQTEARAKRIISDQINLEIQAAQASALRAQRQLMAQQAQTASFAGGLSNLMRPGAGEAQAAFDQAANELKALGGGLTGAVADADTAAAGKISANIAAQTGGLGGPAQGYSIPGLQATAQTTGVDIPAAGLHDQGASAYLAAEAERMRGTGTLANLAREYGGQIAQSIQDELQAERDIQAKRPSLITQQLESLQGNTRSNLATALQALALGGTQLNQAATRKETQSYHNQMIKLQTQKFNAQQKIDMQTALNRAKQLALETGRVTGVGPGNVILPGFYYDPRLKTVAKMPAGTQLGTDGLPHKVPGSGTTPDVGKWIRQQATGMDKTFNSVLQDPTYTTVVTPANALLKKPAVYAPAPGITYQQAYSALSQYFAPYQGDARVRGIVNAKLAQFGFKVPTVKKGSKIKTKKS